MTVFRHDGLKFKTYHIDILSNNFLVSYRMCFKNLYNTQQLSLPHFVNCNGPACCECCQCSVCSETELYYRILSVHVLFHKTIQTPWYSFQECVRKFNGFWTRRTMHDSWVKQPAIKYTHLLWNGQILIFKYVCTKFLKKQLPPKLSV